MLSEKISKVIIFFFTIIIIVQGSNRDLNHNLKFLNLPKPSIDFKLIKSVQAHYNFIEFISILENGNIITASRDSTLKEWKTDEDFKLAHVITAKEKDHSYTLAIELGSGLLAVSAYQRIRIFDMNNSFKILKTIAAHTGLIQSMIKLKNGLIVSSSDDKTIKIWDPTDDFKLIQTLSDHTASVHDLLEMSDNVLISASYDKTIKFWKKLDSTNQIYTLIKSIDQMAFSIAEINGDLAYATNSSSNFDIELMNISDFTVKGAFKGHNKGVTLMKVLSSGFLASLSSQDGSLKIWNVQTFTEENTLKTQEGSGIYTFSELPNGNIVTGGYGVFSIWSNSVSSEY
jgi:WD40 repeat protein